MKAKTIFSAIAFLFVFLFAAQVSAVAIGGIEIVPQRESIFMSRNDNVGILYNFINTSNEEKCVGITSFSISPYISASFPEASFCLNAGESTQIAGTFQSTDAPQANYRVVFLLNIDGDSFNVGVTDITVGENQKIEVIPYETDICRDSEGFISVLVRNKTAFFKKIKLDAENESLIPAFENKEIYLDAFQEKYVKLFVHTSNATSLGEKTVSIYATTDLDYAKKTATINVKDCGGIVSSPFEVALDSGCVALEKEKTTKFYFTVRNLTNKEQFFYMNSLSDLPNAISETSASLLANEERQFYFELSPRASDSKGDHNASLIVWNENKRIEKSKCIRVNSASLFDVSLPSNSLSIKRCESGSVVFMLENRGDTNGFVDFNVSNIPSKINVGFSDDNFSLKSNQEREVYMYVSVPEDANLGKYDLNVIAKIGHRTFLNKVYLTVLEKAPAIEEDLLAIESIPLQVQAEQNSETQVSIKLRNNSDSAIEGINVSIKGLPSAITADSARGIEIFPADTKNTVLGLTIGKIPAGRYKAFVEVEKDNAIKTREFEIIIGSAGQEAQGNENRGAITGLFSFGFASMGGGLALGLVIIIIILLLLIAITGFAFSRREMTLLAEKTGVRK
ncbi:MAG: hypothetical protein PHH08_01165 [Candidatus ainarchaeum sp.]|nr:hypothetical protein [Candidatus ainarchaeum sp.]